MNDKMYWKQNDRPKFHRRNEILRLLLHFDLSTADILDTLNFEVQHCHMGTRTDKTAN